MSNRDEGNAFEVFNDDSPKDGQTSAKLLYDYEKHYMQLLTTHKNDIEFIATLLKNLRSEQNESTEKIIELNQKLLEQGVDEDVKNTWLKHLANNLNRSFQLSYELISHYIIMDDETFKAELQKRIKG